MALPTFNVLSLFSGVGGLDLGLRRVVPTARTVCYVEREAYACAVLAARMQEGALDLAPIWSSVTTFNGRPWFSHVDCVIGGFPCQDISNAGKRAGFVDDSGQLTRSGLWFEYARIVDEVQPSYVFIENVAALAKRGLDIVLRDLAALGFDAEWGVYSAAEAGAPHKRERLFCLAYRPEGVGLANAHSEPDERRGGAEDLASKSSTAQGEGDQRQRSRYAADDSEQAVAHHHHHHRRQGVGSGGILDRERASQRSDSDGRSGPTPALGDDERLEGWVGQHDSGRRVPWPPGPEDVVGWREFLRLYPDCAPSVPKSSLRGDSDGMGPRLDRLRTTGNGVVPDQAALAFRDLAERAGIATKFLLR